MLSNRRNPRRPRRVSNRRQLSRANPGVSRLPVSISSFSRVSPEREFTFTRRSLDLYLSWVAPGGIFNVALPPGSSGDVFAQFGTPGSDNGSSVAYVPFSLQFAVTCLGQYVDILSLFAEYQIRRVQLKIENMMGDSYNGSIGSPLPEVITAIDPTLLTPPALIQTFESYADNQRSMLSNRHPHVRSCVPRPQWTVDAPAGYAGSSTVIPADPRAYWYPTTFSSPQLFNGIVGVIRNFYNAAGSGAIVRMSLMVDIAVRRPR
jgi:hypothetical protein